MTSIPTPTYRIFTRNYDFTVGRPVDGWRTMDFQLKMNDVSTLVMTMAWSDFLTNWFGGTDTIGTTHTYLTNKTTAPAGEVGTGILVWRNKDNRSLFHGPIVDVHRVKKGEYDDDVELTFESDETYLKRRVVFPDAGGYTHTPTAPGVAPGMWETPYYYDATTHQWDQEWKDLNSTNTTYNSARIMWSLVNGNCGQACDSHADYHKRAISAIGGNHQFYVDIMSIGGATGTSTSSYTQKMIPLLEMCQILANKDATKASEETLFEVRLVDFTGAETGAIGGNNEYVYFSTRLVPDKTATCVFSFAEGNILEFDFREHTPKTNVLYIQGDGSDESTRIWHAVDITRTDVAESINRYGWIEGLTQKSDFDTGMSWTLAEKLVAMESDGYAKIQSMLYNIEVSATVIETAWQYMTPDWKYYVAGGATGGNTFWLGDLVTVRLDKYFSFQDLIRQINLKVDENGEEMEVIVGVPSITQNTPEWYSGMGAVVGVQKQINSILGRR